MPKRPSNTASTRTPPVTASAHRKWAQFVTFFLTAVSGFLIFFQFNSVPANLAFDEVEFARIALSLEGKAYAPYTTMANGHATFYYYVLLEFFKTFGVSAVVLRLPSALAGIACVVLLHVILKRLRVSRVVAVGAALLMATTRWYYNFARFSFEATYLLTIELASLLFLIAFLQSKRKWYLIATGVFAGLAFHSYQPGRVYFLLPAAILFVRNKKALAIFGGVFILVSSPLLIYFSQFPDTRIAQVSILGTSGWVGAILENCKRIALMFFTAGDGNGRHNFPFKPAINPLFALLTVFGLLIGALGQRKKVDILFLFWLVIAFMPSLFTRPIENPNMLRMFSALPAIAYFAARALEFVYIRLKRFNYSIALAAVGIIILASAAYDARTYFVFQSRVSRNAFEVTCPLPEVLTYRFATLGDLPKHCFVQKNEF